uniref:Uncharacterized protein n=1 Tax=Nelumbo nucifera TaxID=4432 RepID=A0A822ZBV8_NELNU|nr:TPA_asm: hypothetical protein HUJ06_001944 [Nelumbo nucifera]
MAYDYDVNKLALYVSDDGGSELTFHAIYQASLFAKDWLPFCRKYKVEQPAPQGYFSAKNVATSGGSQSFRRDSTIWLSGLLIGQVKFEEMQNRIKRVEKSKRVPDEIWREHKGFREWDSKVNPRDQQTILEGCAEDSAKLVLL